MTQVLQVAGETLGGILGLPVVAIGLRLLLACLVLLWLATAWWAWRDAGLRTRQPFVPYLVAAGVTLAGPVLFPLAAVLWRIVRPSETLDAGEARRLQVELLAEEASRPGCASCGAPADEEWVRCPRCGSRLGDRCAGCGRPLELDWRICAWCAAEVPWEDAAPASRRPEPIQLPIRPGGRPLVPVMAAPEEDTALVVPRAGRSARPARRTRE